jgi:hypothetical protein
VQEEAENMLADQQTERRAAPRRLVLKGGRIVFNNGFSTLDCRVRNLSEGGARLQVASVVGVPDRFDLVVTDTNERQPCRIAWRNGNLIGVAFEQG